MDYVALDLETSGTKRGYGSDQGGDMPGNMHSVFAVTLILGKVASTTPAEKLPTLNILINLAGQPISGELVALNMNTKLIEEIALKGRELGVDYSETDYTPKRQDYFTKEKDVATLITGFLQYHNVSIKNIVLAGKHVQTFDLPFLQNLLDNFGACELRAVGSHTPGNQCTFARTHIDPAPFFTLPDDKWMPSLVTCLKRAGLAKLPEAHNAYYDAKAIIDLMQFVWSPAYALWQEMNFYPGEE